MWMKWLPWRFIVRNVARKQGFLDPIALMSRLQQFAQPSEVAAPTELLRSGAVLHARGLMNSQAIQHNLDWIWPFWVEKQFNPLDESFVPRAFSITHINLTHRNWTAIGIPDTEQWPIVDPRGLVTPFLDSWSLDFWIVGEDGKSLFPSRMAEAAQSISKKGNLIITTNMRHDGLSLTSTVQVVGEPDAPVCQVVLAGLSDSDARMAVTVRPYNPEGVSFVHDIAWFDSMRGWKINSEHLIYFGEYPEQFAFSDYRNGDVYGHLPAHGENTIEIHKGTHREFVHCEVGMVTAAALFHLKAGEQREIEVHIPLVKTEPGEKLHMSNFAACRQWNSNDRAHSRLKVPDEKFQELYDIAIRTLILHSPGDVYPGPYTYKRFWFRDAAFILNAMLCSGFTQRVKRVLDRFPSRQKHFGYFLSQEGEWDSNGEALWILQQYCLLTGEAPDPKWKESIIKGGKWIIKKRLPLQPGSPHAGLLPSGFSAEHLGPNDHYYWDDFWGVSGLRAAGFLAAAYGDKDQADYFSREAEKFLQAIEQSLHQVDQRLGQTALPASPYRRLDSGAIGSLVADYPLQIYSSSHPRIKLTAEFLMENCFVRGGFFQDMTHSGINPYLTLHIAQVLLRAGDERYADMISAVARLASPTGQWPEAVHPITGGGCMGDGQHVWAAAEWVMMIRSCFVRVEAEARRVILCSGIVPKWLESKEDISFGPTCTPFGKISVRIYHHEGETLVEWDAQWFKDVPRIDIFLPGFSMVTASQGQTIIHLEKSK